MWLTYGNVNGSDFRGNGSQVPGTKNSNGGVIRYLGVKKMSGGAGSGRRFSPDQLLFYVVMELILFYMVADIFSDDFNLI